MSPSDLVSDIREFCLENENPAIVEKYSGYFQDGYDAYGLSLEQIEQTVLEILEGGAGFKLIQQTCRILIRSPKYEETSFAILLTKAFEKDFTAKTFIELEFWFTFGITNWAHADVVSSELVYPLLKRKLITMENLESWKSASNKFQRRAVPVSLIHLIKKGKDYLVLFDFISSMMMDEATEVQQGLGMFLGEAWKINKPDTHFFLTHWKDKAPNAIFQIATDKMTAAEKEQFRIGK